MPYTTGQQSQQRTFQWEWRSELGISYEKDVIEDLDDELKVDLRWLCSFPANRQCADCATSVNGKASWASVNLGVFLCIRCASYHRSLPRSISRPKSCSMDLWAPDELERMKQVGNKKAVSMYGGALPNIRPSWDAPDDEWKEFLMQKYGEERKFAPQKQPSPVRSCADAIPRAVCVELINFAESSASPSQISHDGSLVEPLKQPPHFPDVGQLERDFSWFLGLICEQVGGGNKPKALPSTAAPTREVKSMELELPTRNEPSEVWVEGDFS